MNTNPLYLIEGRFLDSFKKFVKTDAKFAKQRLKNLKARRLVQNNIKAGSTNNKGIRTASEIGLGIEKDAGKITQDEMNRYLSDVDNYLATRDVWKSSGSDLWKETKDLPSRAWTGIKDIFKRSRNSNPVAVNNDGSSRLALGLGAAGLGVYGAKTALDELA